MLLLPDTPSLNHIFFFTPSYFWIASGKSISFTIKKHHTSFQVLFPVKVWLKKEPTSQLERQNTGEGQLLVSLTNVNARVRPGSHDKSRKWVSEEPLGSLPSMNTDCVILPKGSVGNARLCVRTIQGKEPGKQQREKAELERRQMRSGQDASFIYMNQDSFTGTPLVVRG